MGRAFPEWGQQQKQELIRNQFIRGVRSPLVQLQLMREQPETLEAALQLAVGLETVEATQKRLQAEKQQTESLAVSNAAEEPKVGTGVVSLGQDRDVRAELTDQLRQITDEVRALKGSRLGGQRPGQRVRQEQPCSKWPYLLELWRAGPLALVMPFTSEATTAGCQQPTAVKWETAGRLGCSPAVSARTHSAGGLTLLQSRLL